MPKYAEDVQAKCVAAIKAGKSVTEVSKELGPNPKAIGRYCAKAGVALPKAVRAPKAPKTEKPAAAPAKK
jgi:hypothetical protein